MLKNTDTKGSVTVEAAILLPVFIIAIISFVFIIKVYYTHEIIQQAITGASEEMSLYSLLYYETNAEEIIGGIEKFSNSEDISNFFGDSQIVTYIQQLGKAASDYARAQIALVPLTKYLVKRSLNVGLDDNTDQRLKYLHLEGGFDGIDFTKSRMLSDGKSIDIVAEYKLKFPFLGRLLPEIEITQMASSCIWAGEDGIDTAGGEEDKQENIWDMNNIKRGREIRKLQGANLPFNFPVIAIFHNGTATSVKSLNIDEAYYHNSGNLKQKLMTLINKLDDFNGGESSSVRIENYQILNKELRLIIPETVLSVSQQQIINECILIAKAKGIDLMVIKSYGKQSPVNNEVKND